jgi:hypothetical protein
MQTYELGQLRNLGSTPAREYILSHLHIVQTVPGAHSASYTTGTEDGFPGDKTAGILRLTTYLQLVPSLRMVEFDSLMR